MEKPKFKVGDRVIFVKTDDEDFDTASEYLGKAGKIIEINLEEVHPYKVSYSKKHKFKEYDNPCDFSEDEITLYKKGMEKVLSVLFGPMKGD